MHTQCAHCGKKLYEKLIYYMKQDFCNLDCLAEYIEEHKQSNEPPITPIEEVRS